MSDTTETTENTEYQVKVYLAAGWFNPTQAEELDQLEKVCDNREWIDLASPRRIFVCPPDAPKKTQEDARMSAQTPSLLNFKLCIANFTSQSLICLPEFLSLKYIHLILIL